jgi:predicted aspartyl protease
LGEKKSGQGFSFTRSWHGLVRSLHTPVDIESTINPADKLNIEAIWDTGATRSLITKDIASRLNLKRVSIEPMSTPSDKDIPSNIYLVNIILPNTAKIMEIRAFEGTLNGGDMLIGMDVINLGDFAVTNNNKRTMLSFRIPSMTEIDFVKHSYIEPVRNPNKVGRNEPCPCGSGKKYKNCHGKR